MSACAECGTTKATTYVVTQLVPEDENTVTEVCRSCDDELRIRPLLDAFRQHAQDISPDRDPNDDDIETVEDMEADTWVAAAEEARVALGLPLVPPA